MLPIKLLSEPEVQQYITQNEKENIQKLILKKSPFKEITIQEIATQIKGRKIAEKKFPQILKTGIIFPPNINLEQTSSQYTAQYKTKILSGQKAVDLTSGFGIDAYFIANNFKEITLVEQNTDLLNIVKHNWEILDKKATFVSQNLETFLEQNSTFFDLVYIDPARRNQQQKKVFLLEDLSPNILEIQDKLLLTGKKIAIKLSPLIDIKYLIENIPYIQDIHIIAVKNEVKEILIILEKQKITKENIKIHCINLESKDPNITTTYKEIQNQTPQYKNIENYLYIPNNTIIKAQALPIISKKFNLKKLHPNTQLLTSNTKIENFPGRIIKVKQIKPNELKKNEKYNIISKNYPLTPEQIKKKYKLKDGTEKYLIFTQSIQGKIILKSE